jgi:hypothetical protein
MADDALERWLPEPKFARTPLQLGALAPGAVMITVMIALFALSARTLFPLAILAFGILMWVMFRGPSSRRSRLLTHGVSFELTTERVRVRLGDTCRELPLSNIGDVTVVRTSRKSDVGHVVIHRRGAKVGEPSIPTGRRVSGGSVGLVTWTNVEFVEPAEQLFEGALTFWFVAHPDRIRARLLAAVEGVSPCSRGPHR